MQYRPTQTHRAWWFPAVALAVVAAMTWAPVVAAGVTAAGSDTTQEAAPFSSGLNNAMSADKFDTAEATPDAMNLESALPKRAAPLPVPPPAAPIGQGSSASGSQASSNDTQNDRVRTSSRPAATAQAPATSTRPSSSNTSGSDSSASSGSDHASNGSQLSQARSILASLISAHPVLEGVTVSIGSTPGGYQAVAYYKSGRILVNPNHTSSLERILRHEIWHIIDWRDNNHIDWGESVPPR